MPPGRAQLASRGLPGCPLTAFDQLGNLRGTREAPGRQERTIWTAWEAPGRQERTIWTACEAPGRQERTNWTVCEAPGRHQGGRKEPSGQPGRHQGGRKEPFEPFGQPGRHQGGRKGSIGQPTRHQGGRKDQLDLIFNTTSMANGPVRGKSWGGLHARLPSTDWPLKCRSEHRVPFDREAGKDHLDA